MRREDFKEGIRDGIPICLGYFSVSIAFGMTAALSGIPLWAAVAISCSNLTSAGQFAGVNLMLSGGTFIEMIFTMLVINIRYFLMSLSMSQKVEARMTTGRRLLISFGITDEIFAVAMQHPRALGASYMAGLILTPVIGWTGGTWVGGAVTRLLPESISNALGIALYGMFIAVVVPAAKKSRAVKFTSALAILMSTGFSLSPGLRQLSGGWGIILITLVASGAAAFLFPITGNEEREAT